MNMAPSAAMTATPTDCQPGQQSTVGSARLDVVPGSDDATFPQAPCTVSPIIYHEVVMHVQAVAGCRVLFYDAAGASPGLLVQDEVLEIQGCR
jgi:hypothetical protein